MGKISSANDLPDWFKGAVYKKNLDAVDWYREIRKREWANSMIELALKDSAMPKSRPLTLFRACFKSLKKTWTVYYQHDLGPIRDLSRADAVFLAAYNWDHTADAFFHDSRSLIEEYKVEIEGGSPWASDEYEDALAKFFDNWPDFERYGLNEMAYRVAYDTGNPFLHYGRPFEGFPIVVDTTFDDETILRTMKQWLAEVRGAGDAPKAKRPFVQNDFDTWASYRIREVHDLDTWSRLAGVHIPDRVIAAALWPHASDDFSPLDVLRTTSRKKVREIFQESVSMRLYGQLVLERGEDFLEQ